MLSAEFKLIVSLLFNDCFRGCKFKIGFSHSVDGSWQILWNRLEFLKASWHISHPFFEIAKCIKYIFSFVIFDLFYCGASKFLFYSQFFFFIMKKTLCSQCFKALAFTCATLMGNILSVSSQSYMHSDDQDVIKYPCPLEEGRHICRSQSWANLLIEHVIILHPPCQSRNCLYYRLFKLLSRLIFGLYLSYLHSDWRQLHKAEATGNAPQPELFVFPVEMHLFFENMALRKQ